MKLSAKAEYACTAIVALARRSPEQGPARVREIAEGHGIPERYLVQILIQLKAAGLVHSARGSSGGYRLARDPGLISLGEVLTAIDGPGDPPREGLGPIGESLAAVWDHIRAAERAVLERTTIAQLAGRTEAHDWVI
jgi:Rrf2 family transcriptional regulator, cysteine metabolism repressor